MPLRQEEYFWEEEVVAQQPTKTKEKPKKKSKLKTKVFLGVVTFTVALSIVYRYAMVNKINTEVIALKNDLEEINILNAQLKLNAEKNINYEEIEKYAIQNLGMQKAQAYQIEYINIDKEDIVNNTVTNENKNKLKEVILNIVEFFN
jgi:cell division protein FtsL